MMVAFLRAKRLGKLPDYPGYVITDRGEVYSYHNNRWGICSTKPWKKMKPTPGSHKYPTVKLKRSDGRSITESVHSLVLRTFAGPPKKDQVCRHLNGDRSKADLANLQWGTQQENLNDQLIHGTRLRGSQRHNAKLNDMSILVIRELFRDGIFQRVIAASYDVDQSTISNIVHGKSWSHLR
jgi:hypothetical protein